MLYLSKFVSGIYKAKAKNFYFIKCYTNRIIAANNELTSKMQF